LPTTFQVADIPNERQPVTLLPSPFERLLGAKLEELPAAVRRVHALRQPLKTEGLSEVTVAPGHMARFLCWLAGLPPAGRDVPVAVAFTPDAGGGERWERRFAGRRYASRITAGEGREQGYLIEHFGPFYLRFQLRLQPDGLAWSLAGWRLGPLPLPEWTTPRIECLEGGDGDRFTFDIDVSFPAVGWVISYKGWLAP
jgi:hypothetical protein